MNEKRCIKDVKELLEIAPKITNINDLKEQIIESLQNEQPQVKTDILLWLC